MTNPSRNRGHYKAMMDDIHAPTELLTQVKGIPMELSLIHICNACFNAIGIPPLLPPNTQCSSAAFIPYKLELIIPLYHLFSAGIIHCSCRMRKPLARARPPIKPKLKAIHNAAARSSNVKQGANPKTSMRRSTP